MYKENLLATSIPNDQTSPYNRMWTKEVTEWAINRKTRY